MCLILSTLFYINSSSNIQFPCDKLVAAFQVLDTSLSPINMALTPCTPSPPINLQCLVYLNLVEYQIEIMGCGIAESPHRRINTDLQEKMAVTLLHERFGLVIGPYQMPLYCHPHGHDTWLRRVVSRAEAWTWKLLQQGALPAMPRVCRRFDIITALVRNLYLILPRLPYLIRHQTVITFVILAGYMVSRHPCCM